jgi:hypothetical protein
VLTGLDPRDGSPLRDAASRVRVAGFDLTFSAPKSVSVLFGVGDQALRTAVRGSHDRAVREALGYLERNAAAVRRARRGALVDRVHGVTGVRGVESLIHEPGTRVPGSRSKLERGGLTRRTSGR